MGYCNYTSKKHNEIVDLLKRIEYSNIKILEKLTTVDSKINSTGENELYYDYKNSIFSEDKEIREKQVKEVYNEILNVNVENGKTVSDFIKKEVIKYLFPTHDCGCIRDNSTDSEKTKDIVENVFAEKLTFGDSTQPCETGSKNEK